MRRHIEYLAHAKTCKNMRLFSDTTTIKTREGRTWANSSPCEIWRGVPRTLAKPHGKTNHKIKIKMCMCMDGWMDGWLYDLLSPLFIPNFFWHGYPFVACLAFLFGIAMSIYKSLFFLGYSLEREIVNTWSIGTSQSMNFTSGSGRMHDLDQESMKKFLLGSQQSDKTQWNNKQHMYRVFKVVWHMALVEIYHHWETCLLYLFWKQNLLISSIT